MLRLIAEAFLFYRHFGLTVRIQQFSSARDTRRAEGKGHAVRSGQRVERG